MNYKSKNVKKLVEITAMLALIFVVGGIGGVYFNQRVLSYVRTNRFLQRIDWLKRSSENITVINKTEQVTIKEDDSINEIASQASNSVVNIVSTASAKDQITKTSKALDQSATGVIVTSDGLIATYRGALIEKEANYHVFLFNGRDYEAKLLGIDEFSDLAYLKIDASNLTAISFGDSSGVHPGKKVVAIGNSFGEYQNRYAAGLLSNINKTFNLAGLTVAKTEKMEGVLENDFGSQKEYIGGPVIGYNGQMFGITGAIKIDDQWQYFQIPSNMVQKSMQLALDGNFSSRPYLGAYYVSITKEYAIAHNLIKDRGALIWSPSGKQGLAIMAGSPVENAGLKINDIVTSVNNQSINLDNPLANLISQYKKGDSIELTVEREGKEIKLPVKL